MVRSFLLLLRFFDIMIGIVMLGSFSEQRLSFRGAKSPVLTGEAFVKWVLCFEARRPISRKSGSIWYRVWCCRSGLAAGAKLVAVAPRRTPPARSNGTLYHISGLTVEPPQRRQQKNTPARGMFFCWCRWSDSNRHGIATTGF